MSRWTVHRLAEGVNWWFQVLLGWQLVPIGIWPWKIWEQLWLSVRQKSADAGVDITFKDLTADRGEWDRSVAMLAMFYELQHHHRNFLSWCTVTGTMASKQCSNYDNVWIYHLWTKKASSIISSLYFMKAFGLVTVHSEFQITSWSPNEMCIEVYLYQRSCKLHYGFLFKMRVVLLNTLNWSKAARSVQVSGGV